jgi:asparagine synthase (glutamine-hydrolysing)
MCGIALTINGSLHEVVKMGNAIHRRGLTNNTYEVDSLKVYFTHLPITDRLAPPQPYKAGRYIVWLNGYISNYKELAVKHSISLSTDCDTELLAKLIEKVSLQRAWKELNGFFAFVAYNLETKTLDCLTDRYGIKQLYRHTRGNTVYIASEPKALLAIMDVKEFDDVAVGDWLYSLGVMTDHTIFRGLERVLPCPFPKPEQIKISYEEAKDRLTMLFYQSINRNKVKGLNDCVFLSGGVDSGIIAKHINPKYSFSMDYQEEQYSESENIRANSQGIHYSIVCNRNLLNEYFSKTFNAIDDLKVGSCYTNYALTEFAHDKEVTVIYSGAGGDEVFDGYTHRYEKPIGDVIRRTDFQLTLPYMYDGLTHKDYDWRYLKGILTVEDRMAGHFAMETRYPLLDNDLVDFALSLPKQYRENKHILKDISGLSPKVTGGKKRGFSNPYLTNSEWSKLALKAVKEKYQIK